MKIKIENEYKYKSAGIISYLILSLTGLSILFIFPPNELLFTNSYKDNVRKNLFKDFVKLVYQNINTPLIKKFQVSKLNDSCPIGYEEIKVKNEYYGEFSRFYGLYSFCIERFNSESFTYENLLLNSKKICEKGKRPCGKLNRHLKSYICINENDSCPLNQIDLHSSHDGFPLANNQTYLFTFYGDNKEETSILNFEIINNERLCLEKFNREREDNNCEFRDNNECFIHIGFSKIENIKINDDKELYPINLIEWNVKNYDVSKKSIYNFCKDELKFHIFASNYFNFTYDNLKDFKNEFPLSDKTNNSLYITSEASKGHTNIDLFFKLISFILFCWSLKQFVLQILVYSNVKIVWKYYIRNGIILFFSKLIALFGMIIYHFWFYLRIKKVYIILIDEPLNELLKEYEYKRKMFITKIFIFLIIGILIIFGDLIILFFTYTIQWGRDFALKKNVNIEKEEKEKIGQFDNSRFPLNLKDKINNNEFKILNNGKNIHTKHSNNKIDNNINNNYNNKNNYNNFGNHNNDNNNVNNDNNKDYKIQCSNNNYEKEYANNLNCSNLDNHIGNKEINSSLEVKKCVDNSSNKLKVITLDFVSKANLSESYQIKAQKNDYFKDIIDKLKTKFPKFENYNMSVFYFDSKIINQEKTLEENGIFENEKIFIMS